MKKLLLIICSGVFLSFSFLSAYEFKYLTESQKKTMEGVKVFVDDKVSQMTEKEVDDFVNSTMIKIKQAKDNLKDLTAETLMLDSCRTKCQEQLVARNNLFTEVLDYIEYVLLQAQDKEEIEGVENLGYGYTKDGGNIYYNGNLVDWIDADSFKVFNEKYTKDKNNAYYKTLTIFGADATSFQAFNEGYAKDKKNTYWTSYVMDDVDSASFQALSEVYAKDNSNVYYLSNVINGVDSSSFEVLEGRYVKDKNNIYFGSKIISGADLDTFEALNEEFARDKNAKYHFGEIME